MRGIAFFGEQRAGKSTAAGLLVARLGARKVAFADALRVEAAHIVCAVDDLPPTEANLVALIAAMNTPGTKEQYRELLRWLGQHRRAQQPDYWVDRWAATLGEYAVSGDGDLLVCTDDLRHHNEYRRVLALGLVPVKVIRAGIERTGDTHESEVDWRTWPVGDVIHNDGRPEDMLDGLRTILARDASHVSR